MSEAMLIGIDVGTTAVKAVLVDLDGNALESFNQTYPTNRPTSGIVEQNPDEWVDSIVFALEYFADKRGLDALKAIGICSQVNTHVFVDANGNALAPAIVWQDGRCNEAAARLDSRISDKQRIDWWGAPMPVDASHCLARMQWMVDTHPDIWQRTRYVMLPKDYCIFKMTGEIVSDPISNIGIIGPDLNYISELLALVPGAEERLPPLKNMTDIVGKVRNGLPAAGTPLCLGTMDAWSGMFGVGVHNSGQAMYLSGTSEILGVVSPTIVPTPGVLVFPEYKDMRVHAGPTQSGGASIKWYCDLFDISPEEMANQVEASGGSPSGLLFLPHLQGERAPLWDVHSRGTFLGLDTRSKSVDIAKSVYEGVACSARLLLESLEQSADRNFEELNCSGGGFKSHGWNQIRADILGRRLKHMNVGSPGVVGAAGLAAVAVGIFADIGSALEKIIKFDRIYEPNTRNRPYYDELFDLYRQTYDATKIINQRLVSLSERQF